MDKDLDKIFKEAYQIVSTTDKKFPPDVMLKFYAYYKQATKGNNYKRSSGSVELRNAFKFNAWVQLSHLSEEEAKKEYIKLVKKHILNN